MPQGVKMDQDKINNFFQSSKKSLSGAAAIVEVINELNSGHVKNDKYAQACMLSGLQLLVDQIRNEVCKFEKYLTKEITQ